MSVEYPGTVAPAATPVKAAAIKTTLGLLPLLAMSAALASPAFAQSATTKPEDKNVLVNAEGEIAIEEVTVESGTGSSGPNTLQATTGLGRLPGTVQDIPQIVNVVTRETMQQQQTQTLEQVLRNVPGVTMAIGEGGGGLNGDQFKIRGFESKGDVYNDGLRDFGSYVRDSFTFESVEVLKGPSSENFGMGTTGGAINTQTKKAHLGDAMSIEGSGGSGPMGRVVYDVNKQLNETTALRFVAMGHWQDVTDRDNVSSDRAGALLTASFGIGTDFNWDVSYRYQHGDRTPDYGVPIVTRPGDSIGLPITEFGVPRSTFYGKVQDHDVSDAHALTSRMKWEADDRVTLFNDTRVSYYQRDFATSVPSCNAACATSFFAGGDPTISYGGGNPAYLQESWGIQNVSTAVAKFETGQFRHELVGGLDIFYQRDHRDGLATVGTKTAPTIRNPGALFDDYGYTLVKNPANVKTADGTNVGVFVSDRLWFTPEISLLAGARWDYYDSSYDQTTSTGFASFEERTNFITPKVSLIWDPTAQQNYYVSYSTSASPAGQYVTNASSPINGTQPDLDPEESELYEVGTKLNFLDERLGVTGALFQVKKDNSRYTDPNTGDQVATGETQRVRGVELGLTGKVTDAWTMGLAYTNMQSDVLTATTVTNFGHQVAFVPENAVALWTSYEISRHLEIDGKLLAGGGVNYASSYFTSSANTSEVPANFSLDAFVSYEFDKFRVALNGYNLSNELNYTAGFGNRAIPASGRTFILSATASF